MQTLMLPAKFEGRCLSKVTCRKHTHIVRLCGGWTEEKRCHSDLYYDKNTQSTISLCAGIFFCFSLLLFIACAIDPTIVSLAGGEIQPRSATEDLMHAASNHPAKINAASPIFQSPNKALQGLGTVYRKGIRSMNELIVAHVSESTSSETLRLFMRTLHRSGATARADVVLLFPCSPSQTSFVNVIEEENEYFRRLILNRANANAVSSPLGVNSAASNMSTLSPFNFNAFRKAAEENYKGAKPVWGHRNGSNIDNVGNRMDVVWGSVVGFEAGELDAEERLGGFMEAAPLQLRRWVCYGMLLGKVRRKFKKVMVVGVEGTVIVRDAMEVVRRKKGGGLVVAMAEEKEMPSSGAIAGGIRQIRLLADSMAIEIVSLALRRPNPAGISDSAALLQLLRRSSTDLSYHYDDGFLHSVAGNRRNKRRRLFFNPQGRQPYAILHCSSAGSLPIFATLVADPLRFDICSSVSEAAAYPDCRHPTT